MSMVWWSVCLIFVFSKCGVLEIDFLSKLCRMIVLVFLLVRVLIMVVVLIIYLFIFEFLLGCFDGFLVDVWVGSVGECLF